MGLIIVDADDCTLVFSEALQDFLASKGLHSDRKLREHHNIPELFGLTVPETIDLVKAFHRSPAMGQLAPEPDAKDVLPELYRRGHRFVAISACLDEPEVVDLRTRNLQVAFGFPFEAVHCVGLMREKTEALQAYPTSVWVEDLWRHALAGATVGHRAFLLDRIYNRGHEDASVTRVPDWYEIARLIA